MAVPTPSIKGINGASKIGKPGSVGVSSDAEMASKRFWFPAENTLPIMGASSALKSIMRVKP